MPLLDLVLVRVGAFEQAHASDGGENPCQFGHFGHVRLAVERGLRRVETEGEVVEGHVADVVSEDLSSAARSEGLVLGRGVATPSPSASLQRRQGVVIGDEVEASPSSCSSMCCLIAPK